MPTEKQLANLRPIKKGEIRNKRGAGAHNEALKAFRRLTIDRYREVIEVGLSSDLAGLQAIIKDPKTPALQLGIATALVKSFQRGDINVLEQLASRIVGKIPDKLEIQSETNISISFEDKTRLRNTIKELQEDV